MTTKIHYEPHPAQIEIHHACDKRFRCVCTGRRFGKTLCLAAELADFGSHKGGGDFGWVAPTYNVAERGVEAFKTVCGDVVTVIGRAPCRVEIPGIKGSPISRVWFLSADNPDNIRGFGFRGLVIDEAASIPVDVWHYVLRPTIAQTLGWAVFVSTPKGRNWFYDLFTRGLDPSETEYASFRFPSNASPYFPAKEWEEAKRTLPADVFRQEYEAEFLEDSAGVFRNVEGCLLRDEGGNLRPEEGVRNVVVGCDVAKHTDWTVLIAMDAETGRCFAMERFNHLDWPIQKERILGFVRKYRGRLILDASGVGDPIYDDLKQVCGDIEAFKFTAPSKTALVQRLIVAVEQRKVSWPAGCGGGGKCVTDRAAQITRDTGLSAALSGSPHTAVSRLTPTPCGQASLTPSCAAEKPIRATVAPRREDATISERWSSENWDVLTAEMKRYEYQISPSGGISYGAPSGYHDDCVMALALANHRRWETETCGNMLRVMGGERRDYAMRRRRERVLM